MLFKRYWGLILHYLVERNPLGRPDQQADNDGGTMELVATRVGLLRATALVVLVVGAVIAIAVPLQAPLSRSATVGGHDEGVVERAVVAQESLFSLLPPNAPLTATWVVTTPHAALAFLDSIDYGNQYFSQRFCACGARPMGESLPTADESFGQPSVELGLVAFERGPVAVVELSGAEIRYLSVPISVPFIPRPFHHRQPCFTTEYRAARVLVVVNLDSGKVTGRMMASPGGSTPTIDLTALGATHALAAPSDFAPWHAHACHMIKVDTSHQTQQ